MKIQASKSLHSENSNGQLPAAEPKAPSDVPNAPSYAAVTGNSKKSKKNRTQQTNVQPTQGPSQLAHPDVTTGELPPRPDPLSVLTGSLTSSRVFNRFSILLNLVLILACLDMQFAPVLFYQAQDLAFVRVGAVSANSATLVARIPPSHQLEAAENGWDPELQAKLVEHGGAELLYRLTQPLGDWQKGPALATSNDSDWMTSVQLHDLYASVRPD